MHSELCQLGKQGARGQSYLELALALPVLLVLIMGLIEVALLMRAQLVLTNATREGARLASRGVEDDEVAHRAMFAFSHQLPARTTGADANTGIVISRFYVPELPEDPPVAWTRSVSGTAMTGNPVTCTSTLPADYRDTLEEQNQGFDSSHDVVVVEICHSYHWALFPLADQPLYDKTTMRISAQRAQ